MKYIDYLFIVFVILAFIKLSLPNFLGTKIGTLQLNSTATASEIRQAWGAGDAGSLLDVALSWSQFKQLDETNQFWIVRAWSPGLAFLEVPLIWLENWIPIFWSLLFISIVLWVVIFIFYWNKFKHLHDRVLIFLTFLGLMFSWDFRYMFVDFIFYTETIGFGLLFLGLSIATGELFTNSLESSKKTRILAGVLIGLSIWVRHTSDSGLIFLFVLSYLISKNFWNIKIFSRRKNKPINKNQAKRDRINQQNRSATNKNLKRYAKQALIISLIAITITIPWRITGMVVYHNPAPVMSSAPDTVGPGLWALPGTATANYWGPYGMNWACEIDPVKCKKPLMQVFNPRFQLQEAVKTAITHPVKYLEVRSKYFIKRWVPDFGLTPNRYNFIAFFQLLMPFIGIILFRKIKDVRRIPILLMWGSFILLNLFQLLIMHYESRYFIPVRLLSLGLFLNLYFLFRQTNEKKLTAESKKL